MVRFGGIMGKNGANRVVIENVKPNVDCGIFPVKRVVGEELRVSADIFTDGHQKIVAYVLWRKVGEAAWHRALLVPLGNDHWEGSFTPSERGDYEYTVEAWVDPLLSWQDMLTRILESEQHLKSEIPSGLLLMESLSEKSKPSDTKRLREYIEQIRIRETLVDQAKAAMDPQIAEISARYRPEETLVSHARVKLPLQVSRTKALFSSWYECFPRSCGGGTLRDCAAVLDEVVAMGFDTLYLPPIHPIGTTARKGKNNTLVAEASDPGSPWAIGSKEGGHRKIHSSLGTLEDFASLIQAARSKGIELALDLAFQCSPDHPYVKEHPEWFKWRPDGTVQYAENPPKKYQDIVPFDFDTPDWRALWEELKEVVLYWVKQGITIFRVDNPHSKPFDFWAWLIAEVKQVDSSVIFLSEAFTRPKVMAYLAKIGFDQSYTYFTWRNRKEELIEYMNQLAHSELRQFFRPNFWPNTPDILPLALQHGGRPAFIVRLILAATLSSNYGIYGPAFELCVADAIEGGEEYLHSEKYEIKEWNRKNPASLAELIGVVNAARRAHAAFQTPWNFEFVETENESLLAFMKYGQPGESDFLVVVNLDFYNTQRGMVHIPSERLKIPAGGTFLVEDVLTTDKYLWRGDRNYVELNPHVMPAHVLRMSTQVVRENHFDYYM